MNAQTEDAKAINTEVERVMSAARDALTDEMVSRMATTAGDAAELLDQIVIATREFADGAEQRDDMTAVIIRRIAVS